MDTIADPRTLAEAELARLVSRLRRIGAPRLASLAAVPAFVTRADAIAHLVRELVLLADDAHGLPPRFDDVLLGDQLAVVGAELLTGLGADRTVDWTFVVGEIVLHRFDLDATVPTGEIAQLLGGGDLVSVLRERCPQW